MVNSETKKYVSKYTKISKIGAMFGSFFRPGANVIKPFMIVIYGFL